MNDGAELLSRYAAHDDGDAFAQFVRMHFNLVYSAALRQVGGDAHAARDVAQDVFTDAARKARFVSQHPAIVGWLYTSTHYRAAKCRRTETRRRQREQIATDMNELNATPADWQTVRPHLDDAMHALSAPDRDAVLMRFVAQKPYAEIGRCLGLQENAAQMRVSRALEKLRVVLARKGVTSTAAALTAFLGNEAVAAAPAGLGATVASGALAQASASALGAGAVAWHFMITSKAAFATIGIIGAAALGSGWYSVRETRRAADAAYHSRQELARVTAALRAANVQARSGASTRATPPSVGARVPASSSPSTPSEAALTADLAAAVGREMTENPELRRALGARFRANFRLQHAELYGRLGLTPEQIEAVEKTRLKAESDVLDLLEAAAELGDATLAQVASNYAKMPAVANARREVLARQYEALRSLLGDQAAAEFQAYDRTLPIWTGLSAAAAPEVFAHGALSRAERDDLVQLIAQNSSAYRNGGNVELAEIDWDALLRDAGDRLTPQQVAALRTLKQTPAQPMADFRP